MEDERKEREREESARAKVLQFPGLGSRPQKPVAERAVLQDMCETRTILDVSEHGRPHQTLEVTLGTQNEPGQPSESVRQVPSEEAQSGTESVSLSDLPSFDQCLSATEAGILRHALGLDKSDKAFRNRYCILPGTQNYSRVQRLVQLGLMIRAESPEPDGTEIYYVTTDGMNMLPPFEWQNQEG